MSHKTQQVVKKWPHSQFLVMLTHRAAILDWISWLPVCSPRRRHLCDPDQILVLWSDFLQQEADLSVKLVKMSAGPRFEPHWAPRCHQRHVPSVNVLKRDVTKSEHKQRWPPCLLFPHTADVTWNQSLLWSLMADIQSLLTSFDSILALLSVMKPHPFRWPQSALSY